MHEQKEQAGAEIEIHDFSPELERMKQDVLRGLRQTPKALPSQYLYDERGAILFDRICETPEYYPTRTEKAIMERHMPEIAAAVGANVIVIEPGSGSGLKTKVLLDGLTDPAGYMPIDIACEQLGEFAQELNEEFPELHVVPVCADFTAPVELPLKSTDRRSRLVYFPGSTVGNFRPDPARRLLERLLKLAGPQGRLLVGVDLKKDPAILEPAYDDAGGVSAAFAENYLERLNRELDATFDLAQFRYAAPFNAELGRIEMGFVSQTTQDVRIADEFVKFFAGEHVATEYSYKYSVKEFAELAESAGLRVEQVWLDDDKLFSVQLLTAASG